MNLSFTSSKSQLAALPIPKHITLASQSSGRKHLLEKLGIRFRVVVSRIDEDLVVGSDPTSTIKKRASAKLDAILKSPRAYLMDEKIHNLVIAADSMAIIGKKTYGKPTDRENARAMIKELMEKTHTFTTAVAAAYVEAGWQVKKRWEKSESTKVTFGKLSASELDQYVTRYDFTRAAAAYSLNEAPWDLITKIDGSYTNVIGLPFEIILPIFRSLELII